MLKFILKQIMDFNIIFFNLKPQLFLKKFENIIPKQKLKKQNNYY